jgi:hypothetical protein
VILERVDNIGEAFAVAVLRVANATLKAVNTGLRFTIWFANRALRLTFRRAR